MSITAERPPGLLDRAPARSRLPRTGPAPRRWPPAGAGVPLAAYAASRLLVLLTAAAVAVLDPDDPSAGPWPRAGAVGPRVLRALGRWDSAWYLDVTRNGYPDAAGLAARLEQVAFFPLLPAAVRLVSEVTGLPILVAGVLLSTAVGALAVVAVWRLVDALCGRPAADRAAALLAFFPGAFVFSMVYAEGLLILGAAVCLLALHRRQWLLGGIAAAVATAARPTGAALLAACGVAALAAVTRDGDRRAVAAPLVGATGIAAFFAYLWARTGEPAAWFRAEQDAWQDHMDFGAAALERVRVMALEPHWSLDPRQLNDLVGALGVAFAVVALALLVRRWRPPLPVTVYGVGALAMAVLSAHIGPRPRMLLAAFPLVVAVAVAVRGKAFAAVLAGSALGLAVLTAITLGSLAATP